MVVRVLVCCYSFFLSPLHLAQVWEGKGWSRYVCARASLLLKVCMPAHRFQGHLAPPAAPHKRVHVCPGLFFLLHMNFSDHTSDFKKSEIFLIFSSSSSPPVSPPPPPPLRCVESSAFCLFFLYFIEIKSRIFSPEFSPLSSSLHLSSWSSIFLEE